jgi:hypothetical protein
MRWQNYRSFSPHEGSLTITGYSKILTAFLWSSSSSSSLNFAPPILSTVSILIRVRA